MLSTDELEDKLVATLSAHVEGKTLCATLSGGVDSTLLVALAKAHSITRDLVAYTAVTGAGEDEAYAERAARQLGIELRRVPVPVGHAALDLFDTLSEKAAEPLALVGNSIGLAAIALAARNDGFDALLTGHGAELAIPGGQTMLPFWLQECERQTRYDLIENVVRVNGAAKIRSARRVQRRFSSLGEAILHFTQVPKANKWIDQKDVVARATGVEAVSPFLDRGLCREFAAQPVEWFCPDGWLQSPLRRLLEKYVDREITFREARQGLRWSRQTGLAGCRARMRRKIVASGIMKKAPLSERAAFAFDLARTGQLARWYEIATARELSERARPR
jgi:asparagine synthetase B (glutamine-hydrolysing)